MDEGRVRGRKKGEDRGLFSLQCSFNNRNHAATHSQPLPLARLVSSQRLPSVRLMIAAQIPIDTRAQEKREGKKRKRGEGKPRKEERRGEKRKY